MSVSRWRTVRSFGVVLACRHVLLCRRQPSFAMSASVFCMSACVFWACRRVRRWVTLSIFFIFKFLQLTRPHSGIHVGAPGGCLACRRVFLACRLDTSIQVINHCMRSYRQGLRHIFDPMGEMAKNVNKNDHGFTGASFHDVHETASKTEKPRSSQLTATAIESSYLTLNSGARRGWRLASEKARTARPCRRWCLPELSIPVLACCFCFRGVLSQEGPAFPCSTASFVLLSFRVIGHLRGRTPMRLEPRALTVGRAGCLELKSWLRAGFSGGSSELPNMLPRMRLIAQAASDLKVASSRRKPTSDGHYITTLRDGLYFAAG